MIQDLSNDKVIHKEESGIGYLQFRKLLEYPELVHCYTLSTNGFDIAGNDIYEPKKENVYKNYKRLSAVLNIDENRIVRPYQTHTDVVRCVEERTKKLSIFPEELKDVDGLITNRSDIFFSLGFADCTPIYLYDPIKKVIGNIHSGWLGTLKGIGKNAVKEMINHYECDPKDIICCFGPHIRKCHFEVGEDVANDFKEKYISMSNIEDIVINNGIKNGENKYYIDTSRINENLMLEMGLKKENIIDCEICTVCKKDQMHSYRAHGTSAGRNTALLGMIKK